MVSRFGGAAREESGVSDKRATTTRRQCLRCDACFASEGPWNRVCPECEHAAARTIKGKPRAAVGRVAHRVHLPREGEVRDE